MVVIGNATYGENGVSICFAIVSDLTRKGR